MKRIIITFISVFSMCCLVACGSETKGDVTAGNNDVAMNNEVDDPVVTTEATAEPTKEPSSEVTPTEAPTQETTPEPTEEPIVEVTPEPTEEPSVVYEGIDMESDLPGEEWIETFVGIIDEPKVVVYSDTTGRKEIIEEGAKITINPEEDAIALYIPDGYDDAQKTMGIKTEYIIDGEHSIINVLDVVKTREAGKQMAALFVEKDGEEIAMNFILVPAE